MRTGRPPHSHGAVGRRANSRLGSAQRIATGGLSMITSTRRFCCRPDAESLPAIGLLRPLPVDVSRTEPMPCPVRYDLTESERRCDKAMLYSSPPILSV